MINNLSIFIAAHKNFDESVFPLNDMYTILYQNNLNFKHNSIHLNDDFTQRYAKLYSEGCAIHYLYLHQELIKDYIIFYQYGKYFRNFFNHEEEIIHLINKYGCLVSDPWIHNPNNLMVFYEDAEFNIVNNYLDILLKMHPEYLSIIDDWKFSKEHNCFNIFGMKKEYFIEMCDFCFPILEELCNIYNLNKDSDINNLDIKINRFDKTRLIGYFLENLTHQYYNYKFGYNKYVCSIKKNYDN